MPISGTQMSWFTTLFFNVGTLKDSTILIFLCGLHPRSTYKYFGRRVRNLWQFNTAMAIYFKVWLHQYGNRLKQEYPYLKYGPLDSVLAAVPLSHHNLSTRSYTLTECMLGKLRPLNRLKPKICLESDSSCLLIHFFNLNCCNKIDSIGSEFHWKVLNRMKKIQKRLDLFEFNQKSQKISYFLIYLDFLIF